MKVGSKTIKVQKNNYNWTKKNIPLKYWDEEGQVEIIVDVDALLKVLGQKAMENKSGKAIEAGGAVVAQVKNRKVLNERDGEYYVYAEGHEGPGFETYEKAEQYRDSIEGPKYYQISCREKQSS